MPNIKLMESALPVAPLKIAALDSCIDLGKKVNDYIVTFRQDSLKKYLDSPLFSTYKQDNYLIDCVLVLEAERQKESLVLLSAEKIYLSWLTYVTTV